MRPTIPTLSLALLAAAALSACGGSDDSDDAQEGAAIAPPDPDGVLLSGDPAAPAIAALVTMMPSAVDASEIADGLMTTRLEALVEPAATVEEVNDALVANDAAIVSMVEGFPGVTLVVPAAANAAEAEARAAALAATAGFGAATASSTTRAPFPGAPVNAGAPPVARELARVRAAWNAAGRLQGGGPPLPVVLADEFFDLTPHPDVTAQRFLEGPGGPASGEVGNRGFAAAGIVGADGAVGPTYSRIHPDAAGHLDIACAPMSGLTWFERLLAMKLALDGVGGRAVLHSGLTYEPDAAYRSMGFRAADALLWRHLVGPGAPGFVHVQPGGDFGLAPSTLAAARWCSPFALSEGNLAIGPSLLGADRDVFDLVESVIGASAPLGNLRVVGSRAPGSSAPSTFSSGGAELSMVGENVLGPCVVPSATCANGVQECFSTRAASAQVAGILAYLWTLDPTLSVAELELLVDIAYAGSWESGVVDAYLAILGLDGALGNSPVRLELLDVAGDTDVFDEQGDGKFDDHDIAVFMQFLEQGLTSPRFDLNGDGLTGGTGTAPFDLDVNFPPDTSGATANYGSEVLSFAESALTDIDVLVFYALTQLYVGDTERRDQLLAEHLPVTRSSVTAALGQGLAETEVGTTTAEDSFGPETLNGPASAIALAVGSGMAEASLLAEEIEVLDGTAGIFHVRHGAELRAFLDAVNVASGAPYARASGRTEITVDVAYLPTDGVLDFNYVYEPPDSASNAAEGGFFRIFVRQPSSGVDYAHTVQISGFTPPLDVAGEETFALEPGEAEIVVEYDLELGSGSAPVNGLVVGEQTLDWDITLTLDH